MLLECMRVGRYAFSVAKACTQPPPVVDGGPGPTATQQCLSWTAFQVYLSIHLHTISMQKIMEVKVSGVIGLVLLGAVIPSSSHEFISNAEADGLIHKNSNDELWHHENLYKPINVTETIDESGLMPWKTRSGMEIVNYLVSLLQRGSLSELLRVAGDTKVWPSLKLSWRLVVATVIGFVGSACGTVGGVGGGGIFVPMLNLIVGFDTKSAAALSKCMIMGASASSVWYNLRVRHPTKDVPIIDYDLALLFQPMLMMGITAGVTLSVIFPYWLITALIIVLFIGTSSRSFYKGIEMWKQETISKDEKEEKLSLVIGNSEDADYEALPCDEENVGSLATVCFNIKWKGLSVLMVVWFSFLTLQILKNYSTVCSAKYWIINFLQIPVAFGVSTYEAIILYKRSKNKKENGDAEDVCGASIEWRSPQLFFCAFCGILGGVVGGLLGSGGGFILGPLLLELGVIPQVASATATFVMMFSSSLSVVEFYFLDRFPLPYAMYLVGVSILAGFWGQYFIRKLVTLLGRASIIVFILSGVIFVSALTMGAVGIEKSAAMIKQNEYIGFLDLCQES